MGGLSIGIACVLVIFLVIRYETGFDTYNKDADRIYRIVRKNTQFGQTNYDTGVYYPMPEAVRKEFSGIEYSTIVDANFGITPVLAVERPDGSINKLKEDNMAFTRQDYFHIFSYSWLHGDPNHALTEPNTAVITRSLAKKMFGTEDVIGRMMTVESEGKMDVKITGVLQDPPKQTDLPFKAFVSIESMSRKGEHRIDKDNWQSSSSSIQCYMKLRKGVTPAVINRQLAALLETKIGKDRAQYDDYYLQPLREVHYDTRFPNYLGRTTSKKSLAALGLIGLFLLITACINFINLNTAIAVERSREVGVRKVMGGTRGQLVRHFLGETAIVTGISIALGVVLTEIMLRYLKPVLGYSLNIDGFHNPAVLLFIAGLFILITLAAGMYPSLYLSGFNPIDAIHNRITSSYGEGLKLRRGLVIIQFTIWQALIICTIIIVNQMDYARNFDMGFRKDAMVEVELPTRDKTKLQTFKNMMSGQTAIKKVAYSNTGAASKNFWGGNYKIILDGKKYEGGAQMKLVDTSFIATYGLKLLAGRNLAPSDTTNQYMVNEQFAREVGYGGHYQDLVGKQVTMWGKKERIVGVVKNFHTNSLHDKIEPVLFSAWSIYQVAGIRIDMNRSQQALGIIKKAFRTAFPDYVFDYVFLDQRIANFYKQEQKTADLMNGFTMIAILIGCLGLFGLVSYMAKTRTKEIGIRKVLGASLGDILALFGREFLLLIGVSFVVAAPVAWYAMNRWLSDFAYRIHLGVGFFAGTLGATLLLALLTVSYRSLRAALANPVQSLKSE